MNKRIGQTRRHVRRLWLQYGILWSGAVVTGLVAVLYAWLIDYGFALFHGLQQHSPWLPLLLTPATGAACVWFTRRYFPGSEGSGIPQVIAALGDTTPHRSPLAEKLLTLKIVAGKIALSFVAILGGFTIGREGPTVQVGAALMFNLRRLYPRRGSVVLEKRLMLAGAAAGLAAAFNTPLAGIVFAIEELSRSFEQRTSGVVITTIIFAGVVALGMNGNYIYFGEMKSVVDSARDMVLAVILCGVLMGVAGGLFGWLMLHVTRWLPAPLRHLRGERPVLFGALCGLVVAVVGVGAGGATFGSGYLEARGALGGTETLSAFYPLAKMAALIGSYLPGIPGGIFAPSLSIGAGFGNTLHMLLGNIPLPVLVALAMVGYLAAVTQAPITSFVIVMEMINGHALVISLMATALLASRVSRLFIPPLYESLSERYRPHVTPPPVSVVPTPHVEVPPMVAPESEPELAGAPAPRKRMRRPAKAEPTAKPRRKVLAKPSAPAPLVDNRTMNLLEGLEPPLPRKARKQAAIDKGDAASTPRRARSKGQPVARQVDLFGEP